MAARGSLPVEAPKEGSCIGRPLRKSSLQAAFRVEGLGDMVLGV